ncbi:hypothetical protein FRZ00_02245 [Streptomyces mobaraensis]|uniref:Uncharacterized protein n=1 Tax=Streptomyces mobaraensis TaxID=35621 RepID=A0A5N5WGV2_STRMB|nr:hypothetical protein FRZ00_02245 [Streptomyces mobaraensis]
MRGANQSLVFSAGRSGSGAGAAVGGSGRRADAAACGRSSASRCRAAPRAASDASAVSPACASSPTGVRMTTGGMGREPGMLIRIRVVSVVSVFGASGLRPVAGPPSPADP